MIVPYQKTNDKKMALKMENTREPSSKVEPIILGSEINDKKKALKMKKKRESSSKVEPIILGPALTDDGSTDFTDDVE